METWCPIASDLITAPMVPKTKRMYESAWQIYDASFDSRVEAERFHPEGVLKFLLQQREGGKSLHLVRRQLSAIAFFAGLKGVLDPSKDLMVRRAIMGWERMTSPKEDARRLIAAARLAQLVTILVRVCSSPYEFSLFRFTYSLAFLVHSGWLAWGQGLSCLMSSSLIVLCV
ncbi:hypothetical protein NDU88_007132 [Pleurodeles waltl]|uniref:Uncharacterized protein n=1 Tax=Pleurodeles waltl TaxID=8319 RepID=A0AAV7NVG0_PLEWA|nr:hypothetical protein NDU88_007132 [Pleurodeles waltl]